MIFSFCSIIREMFNFNPSKRHHMYSWFDSELNKHDHEHLSGLTHITREQLFIFVEDFYFDYVFKEKHTTELNTFYFPIQFCEEFMKRYGSLAISFETVFDCFLILRQSYPNNPYFIIDDMLQTNDEFNNIAKGFKIIHSYMQYFATFMKRYIDNNLLYFDYSLFYVSKHAPFDEFNTDYILTHFKRRMNKHSDFQYLMTNVWFYQYINEPISNRVMQFKFDEYKAYLEFEKYFKSQTSSSIITATNYNTYETIKRIITDYARIHNLPNNSLSLFYIIASHLTFKPFLSIIKTVNDSTMKSSSMKSSSMKSLV